MKGVVPIAVVAFLLGVSVVNAEPITFVTRDGREFKDVSISGSDPSGITIMTDSGIERVPFAKLPEDLQKKYGYDPKRAAAFSAAEQQAAAIRANAMANAAAEAEKASANAALRKSRNTRWRNSPSNVNAAWI